MSERRLHLEFPDDFRMIEDSATYVLTPKRRDTDDICVLKWLSMKTSDLARFGATTPL